MAEARSSLDIASFYWTLTNNDTGTQEPTAYQVSWNFDRSLWEKSEFLAAIQQA